MGGIGDLIGDSIKNYFESLPGDYWRESVSEYQHQVSNYHSYVSFKFMVLEDLDINFDIDLEYSLFIEETGLSKKTYTKKSIANLIKKAFFESPELEENIKLIYDNSEISDNSSGESSEESSEDPVD